MGSSKTVSYWEVCEQTKLAITQMETLFLRATDLHNFSKLCKSSPMRYFNCCSRNNYYALLINQSISIILRMINVAKDFYTSSQRLLLRLMMIYKLI